MIKRLCDIIRRIRRALLKIGKIFIQQPCFSFKLLSQIPEVLRGLNYSQKWQSSLQNTSLPFFDSPPVNPLKSFFNSREKGKGIWKWIHYFDIYQQHFKKFVGHEVHVLEIGVYSGGSFEMWKDYFGSKCHVYGVDIEEACKIYENEYTKIFIGDQANRNFWKRFKDEIPKIDILIDDGGHQAEQQIVTLEEMLPHLSPGGVYLCEDIHGVLNGFTSYLSGLIGSLNELNSVKPTSFQSWIKSIHFYPYIAVIEKAEKPEEKFIAPKHGTEWQPFYD